MNLLDKYKLRQARAVSQIAAQEQAATVNIRAETLAERRTDAEDFAYKKVYEAWFDEPFPAAQDFDPRDACITRAWADMYDENEAPRQEDIPTFEELDLALEEAAREFGRTILYHDEFMIWFAYDISECELQANEVEASLEKIRPQLTDIYDVEFIINLLDAALAKPPQIPDGLVGFFAPDAPPSLHRTQLKRARQWAVEQLSHFEALAKALLDKATEKAPIKKEKAPKEKAPLTLSSYLVTSRFTKLQLDELLLDIGLLERLESGQVWAKEPQKPWQWASLRAALKDSLLLKYMSHARAVEVFSQAYGAEVSKGTMNFEPDEGKVKGKFSANAFYSKLMRLLPAVSPTK